MSFYPIVNTKRITKALEDLSLRYDSTVRNSENTIVQFIYGDDNLNPEQMENRREYKRPKHLLPGRTTFPYHRADRGCRQQTVLSDPEPRHTVGDSHSDNGLDGFGVEVPSVTTDYKRALGDVSSDGLNSVEGGLDEVGEVVFAHEDLGLFA